MSPVKLVAIAGISGALALLIVEDLLTRDSNVRIRGSSRNPDKLPTWVHQSPRVEVLQIDNVFDSPSLDQLVAGSDVLICAYLADNHVMEEGQKLLINACERQGMTRYIASDWTVDYTKLDYGDNCIKDPMKNVKKYLEESKFNVKAVHILVGVFLELYWHYWQPWNPAENTLAHWGTGTERWEFTSYRTVAQYTAAVAVDSDAVGILKFVGDSRNAVGIAQDFHRVHGISLTPKRLGSSDDLFELVEPIGRPQNPLAAGEYHILGGKSLLGAKLDNDRYPEVKPSTMLDFFRSRSLDELKPAPLPEQLRHVEDNGKA